MNEQPTRADSRTGHDHDSLDWSKELSRELLGDTKGPLAFGPDLTAAPVPPVTSQPKAPVGGTHRVRVQHLVRGTALSALVLAASAVAWLTAGRPVAAPPTVPATARLTIDTRPVGANVAIDGVPKGIAPLTIALAAGPHRIEVRQGEQVREIAVSAAAGEHFSQYVEFPVAPERGRLQVESDPSGARVLVDGEVRGTSPILLHDLRPGAHMVVLQSESGSVDRSVMVDAGATAHVFVPLASKGALSGWMAVTAPMELQLFEAGRLIGTTETERVMMSAGRHDIELVNEAYGYRAVKSVTVLPGKTASIPIELPQGTLHINATPWAEVWIDGKAMGETPLGNLSVPIGPHEVVFRHPQLGEQRHAVSVKSAAAARLSVNLGK